MLCGRSAAACSPAIRKLSESFPLLADIRIAARHGAPDRPAGTFPSTEEEGPRRTTYVFAPGDDGRGSRRPARLVGGDPAAILAWKRSACRGPSRTTSAASERAVKCSFSAGRTSRPTFAEAPMASLAPHHRPPSRSLTQRGTASNAAPRWDHAFQTVQPQKPWVCGTGLTAGGAAAS